MADPIQDPTQDPTPDPTPAPDPRDAHIQKLSRENAERRVSEKELKKAFDGQGAMLKEVMGAFGVETPEDLPPRLSEFRAAQAEKTNPENDPKVLRASLARASELAKKFEAEAKDFKAKYETSDTKYKDKTIGKTIGDAITSRGVKPSFASALTNELKKNVRLNDVEQVVWIQKDAKGNDQYEVTVEEGLETYFKANPDWLPPSTPPGSGTEQGKRPNLPARTDISKMTLDQWKKERAQITGIKDRPKVAAS